MAWVVNFAQLMLCFITLAVTVVQGSDVGTFWHVTDFHYDPSVTAGGEGQSCNAQVDLTPVYGDYWCDSPWPLVQSSIDAMARIKPDVDFIIWTGDTVSHIRDDQTNLDANMGILTNLTDALTSAFPSTPVYATLGNHDFFPNNQARPDEDEFYRRVSDLWAHWIDDANQTEVFKTGGYYSKSLSDKLVLLGLNTNLYYFLNHQTKKDDNEDPAGQFAWMRSELQAARKAGKKVIVTGHVTPGLKTPGLYDQLHPQYREPLIDVLTGHSDVIVATHFGHDHRDSFKILQNQDGSQAVTQFSAPSVTPWRGIIPEVDPAHNPAIRLVKYDRTTGANQDFDQYFMNLTESNESGSPVWSILYTFTSAYNVPDMSVASLRDVFSRMAQDGGTLAEQFCRHAFVSRFAQNCSTEAQAQIYCGGLYDRLDKAQNCVNKLVNGQVKTWPNFTVVALATLLVLWFPMIAL